MKEATCSAGGLFLIDGMVESIAPLTIPLIPATCSIAGRPNIPPEVGSTYCPNHSKRLLPKDRPVSFGVSSKRLSAARVSFGDVQFLGTGNDFGITQAECACRVSPVEDALRPL